MLGRGEELSGCSQEAKGLNLCQLETVDQMALGMELLHSS